MSESVIDRLSQLPRLKEVPKAEAAARKALELDDGLAEAHYAMATIRFYAWDWAAAEREYQRANDLNPNFVMARVEHAIHLSFMGRNEQAMAEIRRARELDPLSPTISMGLPLLLYLTRQYDQSLEATKAVLEVSPNINFAHEILAYDYAAKGMYREAIEEFQEEFRQGENNPEDHLFLGVVYARAGEREKAQAILKRFEASGAYISPTYLALLYASLDRRDRAFAAFEKAYAAHDPELVETGADPWFDPLRSDPRFQDLRRRVGLPQ